MAASRAEVELAEELAVLQSELGADEASEEEEEASPTGEYEAEEEGE